MFFTVFFLALVALLAYGHHMMWQNWEFLQNNPYLFIVTTIVLGIILFVASGIKAFAYSSAAVNEKSLVGTKRIIADVVYCMILIAIAILGSLYAPVSTPYLITGIIIEVVLFVAAPIILMFNKKEAGK